MHSIYLLLGSNLGNRETYLSDSRKLIAQEIGEIKRMSSLYLTESWGRHGLPDFINQVVYVLSPCSAEEVLEKTKGIEIALGRERIEKWGSRTIDIDILFYDNVCISQPDLIIPHPYLHERRFTLEPLMELNPDFVHPELKKTMKELIQELEDNLVVKRLL